MKAERILGAIVLGFVGFVAVQAIRAPRTVATTANDSPSVDAQGHGADTGIVASYANAPSSPERLARAADARTRIAAESAGTYIGDLLSGEDSIVRRWPERAARPVRVWLQDGTRVPNWSPDFVRAVQEGMDAWGLPDVPVRFVFVGDSAAAEVPIVWADRLPDQRVGVTRAVAWNDTLTNGAITIATHRSDGTALTTIDVKRTALHETGHLLGLPHNTDSTSIMAGGSRANALNDRDRATVRLLYRLPWGDTKRR